MNEVVRRSTHVGTTFDPLSLAVHNRIGKRETGSLRVYEKLKTGNLKAKS